MSRRRIRDIRHDELIDATIRAVAARGYAAVTMAEIAALAGSTAASINYYFGSKENLMEATMRHLLSDLTSAILNRFAQADTPRDRLKAIIDANFDDDLFTSERCAVWVQFWAAAPYSQSLSRLHRINRSRVQSHLLAELRHVNPNDALAMTATLQAWMDGIWIETAQSATCNAATSRKEAQVLIAKLLTPLET
jgi:TetR/AcrR family transcriptional repressor of bet genes